MRRSITILFVLALLGGAAPAKAGGLAAFNAAVEAASSHNRVAIGYLRTGNPGYLTQTGASGLRISESCCEATTFCRLAESPDADRM